MFDFDHAEDLKYLEWPHERRCPMCGKIFVVSDNDEWAYTRTRSGKRLLMCSWHCLQDYVNKSPEKRQGAVNRQRQAQIMELIRQGYTVKEISNQLLISQQLVKYYKVNNERERWLSGDGDGADQAAE